MQHTVLYINALIIAVITASLVAVTVLRKEHLLGGFYKDLTRFLLFLLLTSAAYLPLYYDYHVFYLNLGDLTYSIGWDLLWMFYAFFWYRLIANHIESKPSKVLSNFATVYFISYITGWIISVLCAAEQYDNIMRFFAYVEIIIFIICLAFSLQGLLRKSSAVNLFCTLGSLLLCIEAAITQLYSGSNLILSNSHPPVWALLAIMSILLVKAEAKETLRLSNEGASFTISEDAALDDIKVEYQLTDRETDIFRMILQGKNNKEIGEELFIGEATVKTHIHNLLKKLSAANRVEAILIVKEKMQSSEK